MAIAVQTQSVYLLIIGLTCSEDDNNNEPNFIIKLQVKLQPKFKQLT